MEQVYQKIYRSEIPLPRNPLKALNSYIIMGSEKTVIVDTGFNCPESKAVFYDGLSQLGVDIRKAEVVITHLHADHSGLASELYHQGARIFMSRGDGSVVTRMKEAGGWQKQHDRLKLFGFENYDQAIVGAHPGLVYASDGDLEFTVLTEGDVLTVDEYNFEVISVPGHTPDMINLYEPGHGIYFSADHVLDQITPNISYWGEEHPVILKQYLDSLRKIYDYPIKLMLPAHRNLITDHRQRIDELIEHHAQRLQKVEAILARNGREMTVEGVASEMNWRIRAKDWADFPPSQKSFAAGEAMSHLEYLVWQKRVVMREENGVLYFSR